MTDWFAKVPPRVAISIAPVRQDRPPVWFTLAVFGVCVAPLVGLVLWGWM